MKSPSYVGQVFNLRRVFNPPVWGRLSTAPLHLGARRQNGTRATACVLVLDLTAMHAVR